MLKRLVFSSCLALAPLLAASDAMAQSGICERLGPMMKEREGLMQRVQAMGRKNVNPATACSIFGGLAANGTKTLAFVKENKDWCQIPDEFVTNLTSSQAQIVKVRGQACNAAQQRVAMERRARQQMQAQQEGAGTFGGADGFSGNWRVPQGAL